MYKTINSISSNIYYKGMVFKERKTKKSSVISELAKIKINCSLQESNVLFKNKNNKSCCRNINTKLYKRIKKCTICFINKNNNIYVKNNLKKNNNNENIDIVFKNSDLSSNNSIKSIIFAKNYINYKLIKNAKSDNFNTINTRKIFLNEFTSIDVPEINKNNYNNNCLIHNDNKYNYLHTQINAIDKDISNKSINTLLLNIIDLLFEFKFLYNISSTINFSEYNAINIIIKELNDLIKLELDKDLNIISQKVIDKLNYVNINYSNEYNYISIILDCIFKIINYKNIK